MNEAQDSPEDRAATRRRWSDWLLPGARRFELLVQSVIVLSLVSMTFETLQTAPAAARGLFNTVSTGCLVFFLVEFALRTLRAERKLGYIFSFWGVVDLLAIAPALLLAGQSTMALRVLRLLRLARVLKLYRSSAAIQRLRKAFSSVYDELLVTFFLAFLVFFIAAAGIYAFEHEAQPEAFASIPAAMWWAVATLTTVGYGDVYPVTPGGKAFTAVLLVLGLGLVAIPTGLIAAALQNTDKND